MPYESTTIEGAVTTAPKTYEVTYHYGNATRPRAQVMSAHKVVDATGTPTGWELRGADFEGKVVGLSDVSDVKEI